MPVEGAQLREKLNQVQVPPQLQEGLRTGKLPTETVMKQTVLV